MAKSPRKFIDICSNALPPLPVASLPIYWQLQSKISPSKLHNNCANILATFCCRTPVTSKSLTLRKLWKLCRQFAARQILYTICYAQMDREVEVKKGAKLSKTLLKSSMCDFSGNQSDKVQGRKAGWQPKWIEKQTQLMYAAGSNVLSNS